MQSATLFTTSKTVANPAFEAACMRIETDANYNPNMTPEQLYDGLRADNDNPLYGANTEGILIKKWHKAFLPQYAKFGAVYYVCKIYQEWNATKGKKVWLADTDHLLLAHDDGKITVHEINGIGEPDLSKAVNILPDTYFGKPCYYPHNNPAFNAVTHFIEADANFNTDITPDELLNAVRNNKGDAKHQPTKMAIAIKKSATLSGKEYAHLGAIYDLAFTSQDNDNKKNWSVKQHLVLLVKPDGTVQVHEKEKIAAFNTIHTHLLKIPAENFVAKECVYRAAPAVVAPRNR